MIWLLAADNPGGANSLACLFAPARARGHELILRPSGAAIAIWHAPEQPMASADVPMAAAHLVVTGTGFSDFERLIWRDAAQAGIPSVAVVESWMNFDMRFRMASDGTACWPDVVAVPDDGVRAALSRFAPAQVAIEVVGQPHLEVTTARLSAARAGRSPGDPPVLAWVSEPVAEDYPGGTRGFDQYQVFRSIPWPTEARVIVCPHPREDRQRWQEMLGRAELATTTTTALLAEVDCVIGMTSMVLIEAALAGIPALSLQPGRTSTMNPLVDRLCPTVTEWSAMGPAMARLMDDQPPPPEMRALLEGATDRLMAVIERTARREILTLPR